MEDPREKFDYGRRRYQMDAFYVDIYMTLADFMDRASLTALASTCAHINQCLNVTSSAPHKLANGRRHGIYETRGDNLHFIEYYFNGIIFYTEMTHHTQSHTHDWIPSFVRNGIIIQRNAATNEMLYRAEMKNGGHHGKLWYKASYCTIEEDYIDGLCHGFAKIYWPHEVMHRLNEWRNGLRHGVSIIRLETGQYRIETWRDNHHISYFDSVRKPTHSQWVD